MKQEAVVLGSSELLGMFRDLAGTPPGEYRVNQSRKWWKAWERERLGWLTVSRDGDGSTNVMWTTDRSTHWPFSKFGPALSLTITATGGITCYMESAISMWIKWGYGRGGESELQRAIDFGKWAHEKLTNHA